MLETRQPDRLAAGKGLGMADADGVAPEPGPVADRVDHARLPLGLVINELRAVAAQGRDLGVELIGDVDQEVRAFYDLQVDAEVIQDPAGWNGVPGMSDFDSLLQNRASSTRRVAATWSGWASSQ